jgi:hypothetical protein
MRRSSYGPSIIRLWWRRQLFNIRTIRIKWIVLLCFCIPFIFLIPNPFSSQYRKISINQDVQWNSISGLLQAKTTVNIL